MAKAMTLRIEDPTAAILDTVAQVNKTTVSEEIRLAVRERIAMLGQDAEFQARLREHLSRNEEIISGLAGGQQ